MRTGDEDEIEYRAVFAAMSEGVVVHSADGAIRTWNDAALRILGLTEGEISGRTSVDPRWRAIREDGTPYEGSAHPAMQALRTGEPQRGAIMGVHRPDGTHRWISINTEPLRRAGEPAPHAVVVTFVDVTEEREAIAGLRASEERLRVALAAARMGTWEWTPPDGLVRWSSEVYGIFGLGPSEYDGSLEGYLALVHEGDRTRVADAIQRALAHVELGDRFDVQHRIVIPGGELRWVDCHGRVFRDEGGVPRRMIGTVRDATQQKRIEAELARAQRMDSIGRLAGGVAHDFNNLLTAILGATEVAMRTLDDVAPGGHRARELLGIVDDAAQQASRITGQLLAFARKQPLELDVVAVDALVQETERVIGRLLGDDVELVLELRASAAVRAHRAQLEQVLVNLAVNAREAMPEGGRLTIETSCDLLPSDAVVPGSAAGRWVCIVVRDTGVGMPPEVADRAVEPFFTTKETGSGLGLATCYGIARQLGGNLALETAPGRGTRVTLLLPAAAPT